MDRLYFLIVSVDVVSRLHINVSVDALVVSCALPVSASDIQHWVHAESVMMCSTVACHWSTRLIPFRVVSSLARFICHISFSGRSQQASSMMDPLSSRAIPMASKLVSTQMVSSFPLTHLSPCTGSSCITLSIISVFVHLGVTSCTSLSHPDVTSYAKLYGYCRHSEPTAYRKMAYQFPTHGEGVLSDHWRDFQDVTPAKFFSITTDVWSKYICLILEQLWGLAHQAKAF